MGRRHDGSMMGAHARTCMSMHAKHVPSISPSRMLIEDVHPTTDPTTTHPTAAPLSLSFQRLHPVLCALSLFQTPQLDYNKSGSIDVHEMCRALRIQVGSDQPAGAAGGASSPAKAKRRGSLVPASPRPAQLAPLVGAPISPTPSPPRGPAEREGAELAARPDL